MNLNATIIGQMIAFLLFVVFCMKYVWPPIMAALDERKTKIADGLAAAERGKHEQELAEKRALQVINEAKTQASEIIAGANSRGAAIVDESKDNARTEGERLVAAAKAEIEQETNRVKTELRTQVSSVALAGAAKILGREVDDKAHKDLLDELIGQI